MKRAAVFIFYNKNSLVPRYVEYLLNDLKKNVEELIIVSNTKLNETEESKLKKYTNKYYSRKNEGLDAAAFKYVFEKERNNLLKYDEVILCNDTFYGPFISFKEIFKKMESKDIDFWGLTGHFDSKDGYGFLPDKKIHAHIQTFFIAFRKNVINSKTFIDYWDNYNVNSMKNFIDVVTKHEIAFTYYLEQNGFKWDTYVELDDFKRENIDENYNTYAYSAYNLIKNYNCPFIKRKNFVFDKKEALFLNDTMDSNRVLKYIKENKLYDTDLIIENLINEYCNRDLYNGLNLNFIIEDVSKCKSDKKYCVLLNIEDVNNISLVMRWIEETDVKNIFIISSNKSIEDIVNKKDRKLLLNIEKFDYKKYDYIAVFKDTRFTLQKIFTVFEYTFYNAIDNALKSNNYINHLLDKFSNFIDIIAIPGEQHSELFMNYQSSHINPPVSNNFCWIKAKNFSKEIFDNYSFVDELINSTKNLFITIQSKEYAQCRYVVDGAVLNKLLYDLKIEHDINGRFFAGTLIDIKNLKYRNKSKFMVKLSKLKRKILKK